MTLTGTWEMTSFVTTFEDGATQLSYGKTPQGRITYTEDGFMSAHLWDPDRHIPDSLPDGREAYFSYCGTYEVEDDTVVHHVTASTRPHWTGQTITRRLVPRGEEIELIAAVEFEGRAGEAVIRWRRL